MFLEKYLNLTYLNLVYDNYEEWYINQLDEINFSKIYNLLQKKNFYFIDDVILNYLELFEIDESSVSKALLIIKDILSDNYVAKISNNMQIINELIRLAASISEKE